MLGHFHTILQFFFIGQILSHNKDIKKKKKEADADLTSEVGFSCYIKHQKPSTNGRC